MGEEIIARKEMDPEHNMTADQKKRFQKSLLNKPRPRDLFNVQEIMKKRDARAWQRILKKKYEKDKKKALQG